jgi:hypothetical protein
MCQIQWTDAGAAGFGHFWHKPFCFCRNCHLRCRETGNLMSTPFLPGATPVGVSISYLFLRKWRNEVPEKQLDSDCPNFGTPNPRPNRFVHDTCVRVIRSTKFPPIPAAVMAEQKKNWLVVTSEI